MVAMSIVEPSSAERKAVMRVLEHERKVQIINCLCNGMSLRAVSRVTDTHRTAIQHLLVRVGQRCEQLMLEKMRGLSYSLLSL